MLRKAMDSGLFRNIAVSSEKPLLVIDDFRRGRICYSIFQNGLTIGGPQCPKDTWHSTFSSVKAGTFIPGDGGPDSKHYDVKGNLWAALAGLGVIIQIDLRGMTLGFVLIPNGDTTRLTSRLAAPTINSSIWRDDERHILAVQAALSRSDRPGWGAPTGTVDGSRSRFFPGRRPGDWRPSNLACCCRHFTPGRPRPAASRRRS
jgi:hypothetical protein